MILFFLLFSIFPISLCLYLLFLLPTFLFSIFPHPLLFLSVYYLPMINRNLINATRWSSSRHSLLPHLHSLFLSLCVASVTLKLSQSVTRFTQHLIFSNFPFSYFFHFSTTAKQLRNTITKKKTHILLSVRFCDSL